MLENIRIYQQYEFFSFQAKFLEVKTYTCEYQYVKIDRLYQENKGLKV